ADAETARLSREGARAREYGLVLRSAARALRALLQPPIREPRHARAVSRRGDAGRGDAIRARLLAAEIGHRPNEVGVRAASARRRAGRQRRGARLIAATA